MNPLRGVDDKAPTPLECLRVAALNELHTFIVAACDYDLQRASVVYRRVCTTLDNQIVGTRPHGGAEAA